MGYKFSETWPDVLRRDGLLAGHAAEAGGVQDRKCPKKQGQGKSHAKWILILTLGPKNNLSIQTNCKFPSWSIYQICFCDGDSCNKRDIPDIADPEPEEEISHGEPDKTDDGNAASSNTALIVLSIMIQVVIPLCCLSAIVCIIVKIVFFK